MKLFPKSKSAGYATDGGADIPFNKITQSVSTIKVVNKQMTRIWILTGRPCLRVSLSLSHRFTLYRRPFVQAQKAYWIGRLFTHKKGDFETTSVTAEQSCDAPISKEESHISDRIFGHFTTILDYFRRFPKATEDPRRVPKISEEELRCDYCRRCPKNPPNT